MKRRTIKVILLLLAGTVFLFPVVSPAETDSIKTNCGADEALDHLEKSYRHHGSMTFAFEQRTISAVFNDESLQTGRVWLDAAGRFRVETPQETFIKNNDTLWHWIPAYNQVTIREVDSTSRSGWPADFLWTLRRDFLAMDCRIDTIGGVVCQKVRTTAKTNTAAIQQLTIWINTSEYVVRRAEYTDYNDDRVELDFSPVTEDTVDTSLRYHPDFPDSVEVVTFPQKKHQQNTNTPR